MNTSAYFVSNCSRVTKVATALADLEFSRKRIAHDVKKCLESAIANAENNHDLDVDDLVVGEGGEPGSALLLDCRTLAESEVDEVARLASTLHSSVARFRY